MVFTCLYTATPCFPILPAAAHIPCSTLARNVLTGSLPPEWSAMSALSSLDASSNYLGGSLPDSWRDLASLQSLQLANNNLAVSESGSASTTLEGARVLASLDGLEGAPVRAPAVLHKWLAGSGGMQPRADVQSAAWNTAQPA